MIKQMIERHSSKDAEKLRGNHTRLGVDIWCSTLDQHLISCPYLKNLKGLIEEPSERLLMGKADEVRNGG